MKNKKIFGSLSQHIHNNLILYMVTFLFICIGMVIGIYAVKYMDKVDKTNLINFLLSITKNINPKNVNNKYVFIQAMKNNMVFVVAIWFLGLTMIGTPIIFIADLIKGFTIGFTASLVINGLGAKGILLNLLVLFPQNIIYIPVMIILSVVSCEFSLKMLKKSSRTNIDKNSNCINIATYSTTFLIVTAFMILGFFIEGYISPSMFKILAANIGSYTL